MTREERINKYAACVEQNIPIEYEKREFYLPKSEKNVPSFWIPGDKNELGQKASA